MLPDVMANVIVNAVGMTAMQVARVIVMVVLIVVDSKKMSRAGP